MSSDSVRMTTPTLAILDLLSSVGPNEELFGLRICQLADLGSGTVYPILDRLERAGWIVGEWEAEQPSGRPKRRAYRLTGDGATAYQRALQVRAEKRRKWLPETLARLAGAR